MNIRKLARRIVPAPVHQRGTRVIGKIRIVAHYGGFTRAPLAALHYVATSREYDNFTYPISNAESLAEFIAASLGLSAAEAHGYVGELAEDGGLSSTIAEALAQRPDRNRTMPFGRRMGWYAIARTTKPRLIVETGLHDGLGAVALLKALERNARDGQGGQLLSIDIDHAAGWLVPDSLRKRHTVVFGDSLAVLPNWLSEKRVDMFIHDSDHRYQHETRELELVLPHTESGSVLLSDNSHATSALVDCSRRHGLRYSFWKEVPKGHFYPGAGIGLAVVP